MRFRFSSSSGSKTLVRPLKRRLKIRTANTVPTCKRLQRFLGQNRWLQHQLADAELTGEWQVSQIAMSTTDLLQQFQKALMKTAF